MVLVKRVLAWIGLVIFNLPLFWKIAKRVLEFIGFSTAPEDTVGLIDKLNSIPFPVAFICAFGAWYAFLMWPSVVRGWHHLSGQAPFDKHEGNLGEHNYSDRSPWDKQWHDLRNRRSDFWASAIRAYNYWNEKRGLLPLRTLIAEARFPLDLPLPPDKRFSDWVWTFDKDLSGSSAALNRFVLEVYPAATPPPATSLTFIGGEAEFLKFDDYRQELSKFWDHWGRQEPLEQVIREQRADGLVRNHSNEIKFLTYLEIAHERWTQQGGAGKSGLFKLGRRNAETSD